MKKPTGLLGRAAVLLLLCEQGHAADDIHVWVRAFIPDSIPESGNMADTLPVGGNRLALRASDGGCFSTDQRGWSNDLKARSRVATDFHLLIDDVSEPVLRASGQQVHIASALHVIDCQSGQQLAVTPTQLVADVVGTPRQTNAKTQIVLLAAIPDPQRPWSSSTVSYDTTFTYDRQSRTLDFQVVTGSFPAYEAYATLNDGPVITVFRSGPVRRNESEAALAERANVEVKGSVSFDDPGKRPKPPSGFTVQ